MAISNISKTDAMRHAVADVLSNRMDYTQASKIYGLNRRSIMNATGRARRNMCVPGLHPVLLIIKEVHHG